MKIELNFKNEDEFKDFVSLIEEITSKTDGYDDWLEDIRVQLLEIERKLEDK